MRAVCLFTGALAVGCGGSQPVEPAAGPPAPLVSPAAGADDVVVAQVNGQPVWGSCVQLQAARGATRQAALAQCIDFELLAQRAVAYAGTPEVRDATRTQMVGELVERAYDQGYTKAEQFGAFWNQAYRQGAFHYRHENYRASSYVRIEVAANAPADVDAAAKAKADAIAAALAGQTGLLGDSLLELAQAAVPGTTLAHQDVPPYRAGALDPAYSKVLFGMTEIGRPSGVVRTKFGWDVLVWTDDVPAAEPTDAELDQRLMPDVKVAYFPRWVDGIARSLGVKVSFDQDNVAKLEGL